MNNNLKWIEAGKEAIDPMAQSEFQDLAAFSLEQMPVEAQFSFRANLHLQQSL